MYDPDDMNLPESFNKGSSPVLDHMRNDFEQGTSGRESTLPFAVNEKEAREAIALTYGMVTMIDDWVGKIMASLEEQGLLNNTVIIFFHLITVNIWPTMVLCLKGHFIIKGLSEYRLYGVTLFKTH